MGTNHLENYLALEGVDRRRGLRHRSRRTPSGRARRSWTPDSPAPKLYTKGERDFERMCGEEELDLVFNATPWEWHVPVMLAALKTGKHAATEVPAAYRVDDCWALVEAAEKYKQARRDDGELLLRPARDAGADAGPQGHASASSCTPSAATCTTCGRSSSRRRAKGLWRRAHADRAQRQPVPDARARAGRAVLRHQPRQPVRVPGVDEQPAARPAALDARSSCPPTIRGARRSTSSATSTSALIRTVKGQTIYLVAQHRRPAAVQPPATRSRARRA